MCLVRHALRVCSMLVKAALLGAKTVAPLPAAGSTEARLPRWMACTRKSSPGVAWAAARKLVVHVCAREPVPTLSNGRSFVTCPDCSSERQVMTQIMSDTCK